MEGMPNTTCAKADQAEDVFLYSLDRSVFERSYEVRDSTKQLQCCCRQLLFYNPACCDGQRAAIFFLSRCERLFVVLVNCSGWLFKDSVKWRTTKNYSGKYQLSISLLLSC